MNTHVEIVPLSSENLDEAIELAHSVFEFDVKKGHAPEQGFRASLDETLKLKLKEESPKLDEVIKYFILKDTKNNKVIGTTGLYTLKGEPGAVWLGWFCIDPDYRGKGLGEYLLTWTMEKAKMEGYSILRLYTSTSPNEAAAQKLYDKLGFEITGREQEKGDEYVTLYREMIL